MTDVALRGVAPGEHVTAVDIEQVWIARGGTKLVEGIPIEAQRFLVRRVDDEWRVAGVGGVLPIPGWPPGETPRL